MSHHTTYKRLAVALFLGGAILALTLAGLHIPMALARSVTVDAVNDWDDAGWEMDAPSQVNLGYIARNTRWEGEYIWTDNPNDHRTDWGGNEQADLLEFRITGDASNIYFMAVMSDITQLSGNGAPMIQVAIDTDRVSGSGEAHFGGLADTQVYTDARWEYLLTTLFGSGNNQVRVFTATSSSTGWSTPYTVGMASISTTSDIIEFSVPWAALGMSGPPTMPLRFTVATFRADVNDNTWDSTDNSDAVDALTNYGDPGSTANTWTEVSDGFVDYYFDLFFEADGDVYPPVLISEVLYDPSNGSSSGEFIELYNVSPMTIDLTSYKVGDEETIGGGEGMEELPGGSVGVGDVVVVANNADTFTNTYGFLPDYAFSPGTQPVSGTSGYNTWAGGSVILGNGGDEVLLLDASDTVLDVVTYEGKSWSGVAAAGAASNGESLERWPADADSNDGARDFVVRGGDGDPGAVRLIPLAVEKSVVPTQDVITQSGTVTYTIRVTHRGDQDVSAMLTDVLPTEADFGSWVISQTGTTVVSDVVAWTGSVTVGQVLTWQFTALVSGVAGSTVVNTATVAALGGEESGSASFIFKQERFIIINEVDADQSGTDAAEFVELYDGGTGNTSLDGLVLVFFNGNGDTSYEAFDLDGRQTDAEGYFVLCGDAANVSNCDWDVTPDTNLIQNGADAVALYVGDAADFPDGTPVTTANLVDAIVYDTNDDDDAGLLVLLNAGQPQVDEAGGGDSGTDSNQRCPNGSGGQRNTETYVQEPPTPGVANYCPSVMELSKTAEPNVSVPYHGEVVYTLELRNSGIADEASAWLTDTLPVSVTFSRWVTQSGATYTAGPPEVVAWSGGISKGAAITVSFVVNHTGDYEDVVTNAATLSGTYNVVTASAAFTVAVPSLAMTKVATPTDTPYHGEITYTVALTNSGISDAVDAMITDVLPSEVDFLRWVYSPTNTILQNDWITWTGTVSANDVVRLVFVAVHVGDYGDVVANTAWYSHATGQGAASAAFTVAVPSLAMTKVATPTNTPYHGEITYTVALTNSGISDAVNTTITDVLPSEVDFLRWVYSPTNTILQNDWITWTGTVNANDVIRLVFVVTHTGNYGDVVTNTAHYSHSTASGSAQAKVNVATATPNLSISKVVTPTTDAPYHGVVTYTVTLVNNGMADATGVRFTDTLPVSVTFNAWVEQPTGATESGGVITWTGTVNAVSEVRFQFTVTHTGTTYGETITNTAEYNHSTSSGNASASFTVEPSYDVTFIYHDLEDVVHSGEAIYLAGDFNSWNTTALSLTADAAYETFSTTVAMPAGNYGYKYIVYTDTAASGPAQWDWLNAVDRTLEVTSTKTVSDYRSVSVGWANVQWPLSVEINLGENTGDIYGRVYINNVTNPDGEGRGIAAQLGYGSDVDPANWTWVDMSYNPSCMGCGNNDEFMAVLTPTATGVYSYATRFDGNWGSGNPNGGWAYGDTDGAPPFSITRTGVLTVYQGPQIEVTKTVEPASGVITQNGTVTYTIKVGNSGDRLASGVMLTDALPTEADFGAWVDTPPSGSNVSGDTITWSGDVGALQELTWRFTAAVTGSAGSTVINTATVGYQGSEVEDGASFTFERTVPFIIINEVDADQSGTDAAEFVELYDGGNGNTSLDGLVLVFFNGSVDTSYEAFDLDGHQTDAEGYFVLCGDAANVNTCDWDVTPDTNLIQNGADAIALYVGDAADFPDGTPVTTTNLVDAIVYDTNDDDDAGLLVLLNAGQPQVDEAGGGDSGTDSNQRCPNGSGGQRNTETYVQEPPTPGVANYCPSVMELSKTAEPNMSVPYRGEVTYTLALRNSGVVDEAAAQLIDTLPVSVTFSRWVTQSGATYTAGPPEVVAWSGGISKGAAITISFVVGHTGDYEDVVTNTATLSGTYNVVTASAPFTVVSPYPDMAVSKSGPSVVMAGGTVVYEIQVRNQGAVSATNVTLTDVLPSGVSYVADDSPWTANSITWYGYKMVIWQIDQMGAGASTSFHLTATVDASISAGTPITNKVEVSPADANENTGDNSAQCSATVYPLVSIHDIQYVSDPTASDASSYNGQKVFVEGVVIGDNAAFGNSRYFIEDPAGGPWSGLYVYHGGDLSQVNEGDYVRVFGQVSEYYGLTELNAQSSADGQQWVISSSNTLPAPAVITSGAFLNAALAEPYESVLIEVQDAVALTDPDQYGEWSFDDGSGTAWADDMGSFSYTPSAGDVYAYIRGPLYYSHGSYKIEPRYDADIALRPYVVSTDPANGATSVPVNTQVQATFNMTVTNVDASTFLLEGPSGPVAGTVSYVAATKTAVFSPTTTLQAGTRYTATLKQSIQSEDGVTMASDYVWTFTTSSAVDVGVSKSGPTVQLARDPLVYTITVANNGTTALAGVVLTDTLPMSTTYVSDDSPWTAVTSTAGSQEVVVWSVGTMDVGASVSFHLTATVGASIQPGALFTNVVQVSTETSGDDPANNTASWMTTLYPVVTIHDVQYVDDPAGNDASPYVGQVVGVEGVVVAGTGEVGSNSFIIEEPGGGPWSGLLVYGVSSFSDVSEGDYVFVAGEVQEFYGTTELNLSASSLSALRVISQGNALPAPQIIATGDFVNADTAEQWESVLIEFQKALVTEVDTQHGKWAFDDGSGATWANQAGNNDGDLTYQPKLNDFFGYIRGIGRYSYSKYTLEPRYDADIELRPHVLAMEPADGATGVSVDTDVRATFNVTVTNVDTTTFLLEGPSGAVMGTVSYFSATKTAIFTPATALQMGMLYTATLKQSIHDENGVTLVEDYVWSFTTLPAGLSVRKTAAGTVLVGELLTYTITAQNQSGEDLTGVVITDAVPANATFAYALDGGTVGDGVVTWTIGSLPNGGAVSVRFAVTATGPGMTITNGSYAVWASNWTTHETGAAVETAIQGLLTPIGTARGMQGEIVTLAGRATMYTGGFYAGSGNTKFYIQDGTGGIAVQCFGSNGTLPVVTLGDWVTVTGEIAVYRDEIRIQPLDNEKYVQVVDGSPADVPAPLSKRVDQVDNDDDALGWLVTLRGEATRVDEFTYSYEVDISDGQGNTALIYVDKNTGIDMSGVQVGSSYVITGIAEIYSGKYEVKPRIQADIAELILPEMRVRKYGPDAVLMNQLYTYTLTVSNGALFTLTDVVITDALPSNATLAAIGDGGVQVGDVISWTRASLAAGAEWSVHFAMTATGSVGSKIVNGDFAAWASNWITHETGPAVETLISSGCPTVYTPIYAIQGSGESTPYDGQTVTTCGVVVGVSDRLRGVFIQDVNGDNDPATSDGLFIYRGGQGVAGVAVGDLVVVTGRATEYYSCTQVSASYDTDVFTIVANGQPLPSAVTLDPPADRAAADVYMEAFEGMLVEVPVTATVVGPTNKYGETYIVRGDKGVSRLVLQTNPPDGYRIGIDDGIVDTGAFKVGDVVEGVRGPLHFTYANWKVEQLAPLTTVSAAPLPPYPAFAPAPDGQFTVAAFNLLNFDGEDPAIKLSKVVSAVKAMGGPTFLSLEEIATMETCSNYNGDTVTGVISDLVSALNAEGYHYAYLASHPDVGCHGVALLYDTSRVQLDMWTTLQACAPYGSSSATYDPMWGTCQAQGEYPLFSRRPVVAVGTLTYGGGETKVAFIANHFKSKSTSSTCELPECADRRLAQAQLVANYAAGLMESGIAYVAVAGDLNDFMTSDPLNALYTTGGLTNTFYTLPAEARYSYIYNGMSEVLDHILVSPKMAEKLVNFTPVHINADYPAAWETEVISYGVSDHDPVLGYFELLEPPALSVVKTVEPVADVPLGGVVTYTIVISNGGEAVAHGVIVTDVLPADVTFGGWVQQGSAILPPPSTVAWGPWDVAGGTAYTVIFTATVTNDTARYGATVTNTVVYTSANAGGGTAEVAFTIEAVPPQPSLSIQKTVETDGDPVQPGALITYTIVVMNVSSEAAATGVVVTDTLPAGVVGESLNWTGDLAALGTRRFTITATVSTDLTFAGQTITNTAYLRYGDEVKSASAAIQVARRYVLFLPTVMREAP